MPIFIPVATKSRNNRARSKSTRRIIRVEANHGPEPHHAVDLRMNPLPYLHLVLRSAFLWTLCGVTTLSATAHSQAPSLGHQSWSTENGLPQNSVHQIFQSRDGYIWIATEGGIARFNGIDFKVFNHDNTPAITSDDICCFTQTSAGSLWIGTADSLLQYSAGVFRRYSTTDGLPSGGIASIAAASDGSLFSPLRRSHYQLRWKTLLTSLASRLCHARCNGSRRRRQRLGRINLWNL